MKNKYKRKSNKVRGKKTAVINTNRAAKQP